MGPLLLLTICAALCLSAAGEVKGVNGGHCVILRTGEAFEKTSKECQDSSTRKDRMYLMEGITVGIEAGFRGNERLCLLKDTVKSVDDIPETIPESCQWMFSFEGDLIDRGIYVVTSQGTYRMHVINNTDLSPPPTPIMYFDLSSVPIPFTPAPTQAPVPPTPTPPPPTFPNITDTPFPSTSPVVFPTLTPDTPFPTTAMPLSPSTPLPTLAPTPHPTPSPPSTPTPPTSPPSPTSPTPPSPTSPTPPSPTFPPSGTSPTPTPTPTPTSPLPTFPTSSPPTSPGPSSSASPVATPSPSGGRAATPAPSPIPSATGPPPAATATASPAPSPPGTSPVIYTIVGLTGLVVGGIAMYFFIYWWQRREWNRVNEDIEENLADSELCEV